MRDTTGLGTAIALGFTLTASPLPALPPEYFVLIDRGHGIPADFSPELVEVNIPRRLLVELHPEAAEALGDLFIHARSVGIALEVASAYRTVAQQGYVYEKWMTLEMSLGKSEEEARRAIATYFARPGHSEHHLGTAVDLNIAGNEPYGRAGGELYAYLSAYAHRFGWVLSYPRGREADTGYIFEPWHVRYVGIDLAVALADLGYLGDGPTLNLVLEDFVFKP